MHVRLSGRAQIAGFFRVWQVPKDLHSMVLLKKFSLKRKFKEEAGRKVFQDRKGKYRKETTCYDPDARCLRGSLGEAAQAGKGCGLVSFPPAEAERPWQTF